MVSDGALTGDPCRRLAMLDSHRLLCAPAWPLRGGRLVACGRGRTATGDPRIRTRGRVVSGPAGADHPQCPRPADLQWGHRCGRADRRPDSGGPVERGQPAAALAVAAGLQRNDARDDRAQVAGQRVRRGHRGAALGRVAAAHSGVASTPRSPGRGKRVRIVGTREAIQQAIETQARRAAAPDRLRGDRPCGARVEPSGARAASGCARRRSPAAAIEPGPGRMSLPAASPASTSARLYQLPHSSSTRPPGRTEWLRAT